MTPYAKPSRAFVPMIALMMSMVALSTDIMLSALPSIQVQFAVSDAQLHWVITMIFVGFGLAQLFVGPLSDAIGRKPVVLGAFVLVIGGGVLCAVSTSFEMLLLGRFIQGVGIAGPRVLATAIVRDLFVGPDMARVMSVVMVTFILAPVLGPAVGQAVEVLAGWRAIFMVLVMASLLSAVWYGFAQAETLDPTKHRALTFRSFASGFAEVVTCRPAVGHTLVSGFMFGPFLAYVAMSKIMFDDIYQLGTLFPIYFALGAGSIGIAALVNSMLVHRFGMLRLARGAFQVALAGIVLFTAFAWTKNGLPPLWSFMAFLMLTFFCIGLNFGNISALAMEPLGHMAGMGAAVFGFLSTFVSLPIVVAINAAYDTSVLPLAFGFLICSVLALISFEWATR